MIHHSHVSSSRPTSPWRITAAACGAAGVALLLALADCQAAGPVAKTSGLPAADPSLPAAATPGFIAGDVRPADGPAVRVQGGWMVPYDESIPGTTVSFRMMPVPGGTFRMGSASVEDGRTADEGPAFEVTVQPCWMGRCEVTWAEYRRYMEACELFTALQSSGLRLVTPDNEADAVTAPSNLYDPTTTFTNGEDEDLPAVTMTQFAARQYTKWLSGLTGRFYRVPSEAEWEHACRADTDTPWHCGADQLAAAAVAASGAGRQLLRRSVGLPQCYAAWLARRGWNDHRSRLEGRRSEPAQEPVVVYRRAGSGRGNAGGATAGITGPRRPGPLVGCRHREHSGRYRRPNLPRAGCPRDRRS